MIHCCHILAFMSDFVAHKITDCIIIDEKLLLNIRGMTIDEKDTLAGSDGKHPVFYFDNPQVVSCPPPLIQHACM